MNVECKSARLATVVWCCLETRTTTKRAMKATQGQQRGHADRAQCPSVPRPSLPSLYSKFGLGWNARARDRRGVAFVCVWCVGSVHATEMQAHPSALCATFRAICHREKRALGWGEGEMKREPRCAHPGIDHGAGAMLHGGWVQGGGDIRMASRILPSASLLRPLRLKVKG